MTDTSFALAVKVNGARHNLDVTDIDRREWKDIKAALGMTQMEVFGALAALDLDAIAALVWVTRRREQPDLAFDDVDPRLSDVLSSGAEEDAAPPA